MDLLIDERFDFFSLAEHSSLWRGGGALGLPLDKLGDVLEDPSSYEE
jgi:hypothetical protein